VVFWLACAGSYIIWLEILLFMTIWIFTWDSNKIRPCTSDLSAVVWFRLLTAMQLTVSVYKIQLKEHKMPLVKLERLFSCWLQAKDPKTKNQLWPTSLSGLKWLRGLRGLEICVPFGHCVFGHLAVCPDRKFSVN